jgi:hypothetical protein
MSRRPIIAGRRLAQVKRNRLSRERLTMNSCRSHSAFLWKPVAEFHSADWLSTVPGSPTTVTRAAKSASSRILHFDFMIYSFLASQLCATEDQANQERPKPAYAPYTPVTRSQSITSCEEKRRTGPLSTEDLETSYHPAHASLDT